MIMRGGYIFSILNKAKRLALVFVLVAGIIPNQVQSALAANDEPNVSSSPPSREAKLTSSFSDVVAKIAPSVVYVYSTRTVHGPSASEMSPFNDPFFRQFFGDQFNQNSTRQRSYKEQGLGSGVIVTKDGYILTNNHVVEGADEVKVAEADNDQEYTAKIVGRDPQTDVAVLKIEAKDLPVATLADSDKIKVGDVVLAVGNPFGVGQTVTMGIVSATRRGGMGIEHYEDFIQTDAAINPGNSGGALVDTEGRVIGINTAILSRSGGYQGVGFAVPINLAKNVMNQLIKTGHVERGYLGVSIQNLTPDLAKEFDVPNQQGALIGGVSDNSAAEEAGLKSGDVIVEFNGKTVADSRQLMLLVGSMSPGAKAKVKVLRDGHEKTVEVTLKKMPERMLAGGGQSESNSIGILDGVTLSNIDSSARQQLDLPDSLKGALVTNIDPGCAAYEAGLRTGDVIQQIGRKNVTDAESAASATHSVNAHRVLLRIWRDGGSRYVVVTKSNE